MKYLPLYFIIINVVTFIIYCLDKYLAKKHLWRVPERVLFFFSLLGGFVGSILGMVVFHHKTKKVYFYIWNIFIMILWIGLLCYFNQ